VVNKLSFPRLALLNISLAAPADHLVWSIVAKVKQLCAARPNQDLELLQNELSISVNFGEQRKHFWVQDKLMGEVS